MKIRIWQALSCALALALSFSAALAQQLDFRREAALAQKQQSSGATLDDAYETVPNSPTPAALSGKRNSIRSKLDLGDFRAFESAAQQLDAPARMQYYDNILRKLP